jgi:dipeptidase E
MVNDLQEVDSLDDYDAVYIGGGNTFNLLEEIKSSRFDLKLSSYIQKGGLVYGGSAGAIILGKDITTSPDKNTTNLASFKGLNLLNGFSVWPHYDLKEEQGLQSFLKGKNKVIAIPEQSGAYVEDNKILNLGNAPIVIFDPKRKEVKPGQYVKI